MFTDVCPVQTDWFLPFSGTRWQFSEMGFSSSWFPEIDLETTSNQDEFLLFPIPRNRFPYSDFWGKLKPRWVSPLLVLTLLWLYIVLLQSQTSCKCTITLASFKIIENVMILNTFSGFKIQKCSAHCTKIWRLHKGPIYRLLYVPWKFHLC